MNPVAEDILMHYGMPKRSGRYPWGSGDNPHQHSGDFLSRVEEMKKQGYSEKQIMEDFDLSSTQFRDACAIAKSDRRLNQVQKIKSLQADGLNNSEIGRQMGIRESTVRSLLDEDAKARSESVRKTADFLKEQVDTKGMIDIGKGVERELGLSPERLRQATYVLEMEEGYHVYGGRVEQATNPGKHTTLKVLCPPDSKHADIYQLDKINTITDYKSDDGGETFRPSFVYPKSMDSKRLQIRYAEEGGIEKDGVIELRRGVDDLSLGESHYAQVRILVDNTHYLKGMAVYSDDMPDGVDVVFNTNKKLGTDMKSVLKKIKEDPVNPFGSLIKEGGQSYYTDKDGKKQLSLINKRADESDWSDWSDALPSQFLSKQPVPLIRKQLNLTKMEKKAEFDEICALTNPTVKKHMLETFANDCDSAAVHLKAAALPRQKYHVILPLPGMKDNEVYAPNYNNGEQVALVRYPHGGTFEIPILTVNNNIKTAKKLLGSTPTDAICINSKVAERLSGADFDGDTVMVLPTNNNIKIKSTKPLKGLEGFDPKLEYPYREGMKVMSKTNTGKEMGNITNLIADMTLKGADDDELARAVRHSMVVIDAHKHNLDYKRSEEENGIKALKQIYQKHDYDDKAGGAATLITRAKSQATVDKRQGQPVINKKGHKDYDPTKPEGALIWKTADDLYYEKTTVNKRTGEVTTKTMKRTQRSTKMEETDDAYSLVSDFDTPQERQYAEYANTMKAMANNARKEMVYTKDIEYSAAAKATYQTEVDSLKAKLNLCKLNAPKERRAQVLANANIAARQAANPDMTKEDLKKVKQQELTAAREKVGAKRVTVNVTPQEWEAIQAGAINKTTLKDILNHTDLDVIRQYATPRTNNALTTAQINRVSAYAQMGYTTNEIAKMLGKSPSTISKYLNGKE